MKRKNVFVILLLLGSLLFALNSPAFAQVQNWEDSGCMVDGVPTLKCLETVYGNILYLSSALVLIILFLMLVYGAFVYMTSMGNASKIQQGANIIKWSFVGLGVFLASYVILFIIDVAFLGGKGEIFRFRIPGPGD